MNPKILVVAEHDNQHLKPATLNVIAAASQLSEEIHVIVLGNQCRSVAEEASRIEKIKQVHLMQADFLTEPLAEEFANGLKEIAQTFSHILAPVSTFRKNFLPRLAAVLDVGQVSDVIKIFSEESFLRPMYAGNVLATVQAIDPIKILSIRTSAFEPAKTNESSKTNEPAKTNEFSKTNESAKIHEYEKMNEPTKTTEIGCACLWAEI